MTHPRVNPKMKSWLQYRCEAAPLSDEGAASFVHLFPLGQIKGRDGREFALSRPKAVIARFKAGKIDLPIDYEHQVDEPGRRLPGPVPAAGWIKSLELRADGIWGSVEWTKTAAKMIAEKEYRFLSPSFMATEDTKEIMRILGAGLVHRPCLELKALAKETENTMDTTETDYSQIAEALGLSATAGMDEILAAIAATKTVNPAEYVPISAVKDLLSKRNTERATASVAATEIRVEKAMQEGYLTPAMRPWAISLCQQSPAAFEDFLSSTGPQYAHLFKEYDFSGAQADLERSRVEQGADVNAISEQLGISKDALK